MKIRGDRFPHIPPFTYNGEVTSTDLTLGRRYKKSKIYKLYDVLGSIPYPESFKSYSPPLWP